MECQKADLSTPWVFLACGASIPTLQTRQHPVGDVVNITQPLSFSQEVLFFKGYTFEAGSTQELNFFSVCPVVIFNA